MPEHDMSSWLDKVTTDLQFVKFINSVGCCTAKPIPTWPLFPNQQQALANMGLFDVWFWKDDLHTEKKLFYTRLFGGKPGYISNGLLPAFVARYGCVFDELLFRGELPAGAVEIYQCIERHGPIPIRELNAQLSAEAKTGADTYLHLLDRKFLITKSGITGRTRGTYGYIWDTTERWMPDVLQSAGKLGSEQAMQIIRDHMLAYGITPECSFWKRVMGETPSR
ncbi:MAG: AlkZ-related protein [Armatimonadota bacterium]